MDLRIFITTDWWNRKVLQMVRRHLIAHQDDDGADPADDEELYEHLLLALYPLDGYDGRLTGSNKKQ